MKMLLIGLVAGLVGGISVSGWAHFRIAATPSLDIQELHAQMRTMDRRMERRMSRLLAEIRSTPQGMLSGQDIDESIKRAISGCAIIEDRYHGGTVIDCDPLVSVVDDQ